MTIILKPTHYSMNTVQMQNQIQNAGTPYMVESVEKKYSALSVPANSTFL